MLAPEQFFYFEILGDNYHKEEIVGLAWGDSRQIYVGSSDLLQQPLFSRIFGKTALKPTTSSGPRYCSVITALNYQQLL